MSLNSISGPINKNFELNQLDFRSLLTTNWDVGVPEECSLWIVENDSGRVWKRLALHGKALYQIDLFIPTKWFLIANI
jgi:hypothetical protein